jgi:replicative superfamily II helicase
MSLPASREYFLITRKLEQSLNHPKTKNNSKMKAKLNEMKRDLKSSEIPPDSILISNEQWELLKKQMKLQAEDNYMKEIELDSLRRGMEEMKKREKIFIVSNENQAKEWKSKVSQLQESIKKLRLGTIVSDDIEELRASKRNLELDLYKEQLKFKKMQEQLEHSNAEKKQLQARFSTALIKNIHIVKELREKQAETRLENVQLKRVLSLLEQSQN